MYSYVVVFPAQLQLLHNFRWQKGWGFGSKKSNVAIDEAQNLFYFPKNNYISSLSCLNQEEPRSGNHEII